MYTFQCEECLCNEYSEEVGSGEEDGKEFTAYECEECEHVTRIYD